MRERGPARRNRHGREGDDAEGRAREYIRQGIAGRHPEEEAGQEPPEACRGGDADAEVAASHYQRAIDQYFRKQTERIAKPK